MILYNNIHGITVAMGTSDALSPDSMDTSITWKYRVLQRTKFDVFTNDSPELTYLY
jgi:hypothetical protein